MTKNKIYFFIVFSFALLAFSSCGKGKIAESEAKTEVLPAEIVELREDQIKQAGVELGKIETRSLSGTLKVSGKVAVAPENMATVCMPMGGFIKKTSMMPGSKVSKGQTLAVIENQEFVDIQQNYLETKNKFDYAESEFKRHTELYKNDVYSEKNIQQVTTDYKNLKTQVNALKQKLVMIGINPDRLNEDNISRSVALVSPISGYVKTVNVNLGKYVSSSDVLFEIVNSNNLFLELTLFEKDATNIAEGQQIHFFINNEKEQHKAVIYQTAKSINDNKSYQVFAKVSDYCKNIIPGMYVNAIIESSNHKGLTLPSEAIVSFDDKNYIFVFEKNKIENGKQFAEYRMIEIQKGIINGDITEITLPDNINADTAKIVVKGAYNLLSAMKNAGEMSC